MTNQTDNSSAQEQADPANSKQRDMQGDMQNAADDPSRWRELQGEEIADSTDTTHDRSREAVKQANEDQ